MTARQSREVRTALITLGALALGFLTLQAIGIALHGRVCNYSSAEVWLTISKSSQHESYPLARGACTNMLTQDAEAIWGLDCSSEPCRHRAWKVGAGHYAVYDDRGSSVVRIDGWGAGSRWRISEDWPRPDLSAISYSLVR